MTFCGKNKASCYNNKYHNTCIVSISFKMIFNVKLKIIILVNIWLPKLFECSLMVTFNPFKKIPEMIS